MVAAGGEWDNHVQITDSVDVLHIKGGSLAKTWQRAPSMPVALSNAASVTTSDQARLLVAGGILEDRQECSAALLEFKCIGLEVDNCQ